MSARFADLAGIDMESGVSEAGKPFCRIRATSADGTVILLGQLSPDDMRRYGLSALEVAEAADQDAAVLAAVRKLDLPDQMAAVVIRELRESRTHG
jgi:hypothetical protein